MLDENTKKLISKIRPVSICRISELIFSVEREVLSFIERRKINVKYK